MRHSTLTTALVLGTWVAMTGQAMAQGGTGQPVTRMYSDAQGETHIETVMMDVRIRLPPPQPSNLFYSL